MRTRRPRFCLAGVWLIGCAGIPGPGPTSTGGGGGAVTPAPASVAASVITYTNQERARNGLPAFTTSARLMDAAAIQARQMATYRRLDHVIPEAQYPTPDSRLEAVGYLYRDAAENVAWNQIDARAAVASWMASSAHRANILDKDLTQIGAAMARSVAGEPYWVQVFGTPRAQ